MSNRDNVLRGGPAALAIACTCLLWSSSFTSVAGRAAGVERERNDEAAALVVAQTVAQPKANGKIAFVSGRDTERLDVYVMNPDGSGIVRLTDGRSYNVGPVWSPDGRTLAFVSNRDGKAFVIYLMDADGGNVRRLTSSTEEEATPAWSPDGTKVAFARGNFICLIGQSSCPGPDLYVVDADGRNERRLTTGRVGDYSPSWSPDGSKIAFNSMRDGNSEIYLMNPDGSGLENVTRNAGSEDWQPAWSPDGTRIAFVALRSGRFDVYSMKPDGSEQTNLTKNATNEIIEGPAWSPDGRKIVYSHFLRAPGGQAENRDLFVMNADGSGQTRLTTHPDFDVEPDWQPLARASNGPIAFTSERDGNREAYRMNPDGGAQVNLTTNAAQDFNPVWSPDGTKLLFASDRGGGTYQRTQFYVMEANGGGVTRITNFPDVTDVSFSEPAWSPDSKKIVFVASSFGAVHSVVVMNADGTGEPKTIAVTRGSASDVDPAWSPDGTRIAYVGTEGVSGGPGIARTYLFVVNADGTGRTRITEVNTGSATPLGGPAWSPDGTRLAFASDRDGDAEIYVIPASGGTTVRVTDNAAQDLLPAWSPDGRKLAFTSDRDGNREIYSADADGSNQTRLTNNAAPDHDPDWASAGARPSLLPDFDTLQFGDFSYVIQEDGDGSSDVSVLQVTVTRLGDRSREATVNYRTVDLCVETPSASCFRTASERSDFTTAAGRLRFAPGESSKTFSVLITNDHGAEGYEVFAVELTNAVGAGLGGQARASVVIMDDDATNAAGNPIDDRAFFVRQHYLDFFSRVPDAEGLRFWVNQIPERCGTGTPPTDAACLAARENVSAAFFLSIEFQETGFFVHRAYQAAFNRFPRFREEFLPDTQELGRGVVVGQGAWEERLELNKREFALWFVRRAEFLLRYPESLKPADFVDALASNAGAAITSSERAQLVAQLSADYTDEGRARVLRAVVEDSDFAHQETNRAFVLMQYFGYLRRNPNDPPDNDFSGYNFWLSKLNQFGGDFRRAEMVRAFLLSGEYRSRFIQ